MLKNCVAHPSAIGLIEEGNVMKRKVINLGLSLIGPITLIILLSMPIGPLTGGLGILQPWGGIFDAGRGLNEPVRQTIKLPGVENEVSILIDHNGVPHIYADTVEDAYVGLGYMQARDRLFQMYMQNRLAAGRVSEVVGAYANSSDKIYRTIGLARAAQASLDWYLENAETHPEAGYALDLMNAQVNGINFFIDHMTSENTPLEFKILGIDPEPWTMKDMFLGASFITWSLTGDFDDLKRLWLKEHLQYDSQYEELYPDVMPFTNFTIREQTNLDLAQYPDAPGGYPAPDVGALNIDYDIYADIDSSKLDILLDEVVKIVDPFALKDTFGSNNWAINGSKSSTGSPILCMDAHMPLTAPNLVYEAHMSVPGVMNVMGITLPGMPSVEAGFNEYIAWGFTNGGVDVLDIFVEDLNPTNSSEYYYNGDYRALKVIDETIHTKEGIDISFQVKESVHGPLIDSIVETVDDSPANIAMNWTGNSVSHLIMAATQYNKARNMTEFFDAIYWWDNPVFNFAYADVEGNIAMTVCGRFPVRSGYTGLLPVTALNDSVGMVSSIPYAHLPREINPSRGFVTSTNQRSIDPAQYNYTLVGPFSDGYRSRRISELLSSDDDITVEDMMRFQADAIEIRARSIVPLVVSAWDDHMEDNDTIDSILDWFGEWNFEMSTDSESPTVWLHLFDAIRIELFDELHFLEDELSDATMTSSVLPSSPYPHSPVIEQILLEDVSEYFDDERTTGIIESRDDILVRSLHRAIDELYRRYGSDILNWTYGLHHTVNVEHMAGFTTIEGGAIRGQHTLFPSHGWEMSTGPVYRFVIDLATKQNTRFVVAGGQSGNIFSEHFDDLFQLWYSYDAVEGHFQYHEIYYFAASEDFVTYDVDGVLIERRITFLP
jgi:penicillin amidase